MVIFRSDYKEAVGLRCKLSVAGVFTLWIIAVAREIKVIRVHQFYLKFRIGLAYIGYILRSFKGLPFYSFRACQNYNEKFVCHTFIIPVTERFRLLQSERR